MSVYQTIELSKISVPDARLEEAVTAFRAALEEQTRERVPLKWAGTQSNLGVALKSLGLREIGTARLEEAVTAIRTVRDFRKEASGSRSQADYEQRIAAIEQLIVVRSGRHI